MVVSSFESGSVAFNAETFGEYVKALARLDRLDNNRAFSLLQVKGLVSGESGGTRACVGHVWGMCGGVEVVLAAAAPSHCCRCAREGVVVGDWKADLETTWGGVSSLLQVGAWCVWRVMS